MRLSATVLLATLFLGAICARAEDDPARGRELYSRCVACHGESAQGNPALNAPRINHLAPVYIAAQLQKFQSGIRGGEGAGDSARQMAAIAGTLPDDQAVYDTAAYIATLDSPPAAASVDGDAAAGSGYYRQFCAACHGPAAQGNPALNSPRLAGADDWYLLAQLSAFRSGARGAHPEDRTGRQMRAMAGVLPDEQAVNAVIAYIHGLGE